MKIQELKGAILATSVYCGGVQIGVNVAVTLPEVLPETTEVTAAGGTVELPVYSKLQGMEATVTKQGIDKAWLKAVTPDPQDLIVNIVQQSVSPDGISTPEHIKAFLRVVPKGSPGVEASYGEASENEIAYTVLSYRLTVNGSTFLHADPVKAIYEVNGKDYMGNIKSML